MRGTQNIGKVIRLNRQARRESLAELAKAVDVERSYLNKIELGKANPSEELVNRIFVHFSVEGNKAKGSRSQDDKTSVQSAVSGSGKGEIIMFDQQAAQPMTQVAMNPMQTPVLYTDSTFVSASEYGLVLDVAQNINGQQQTVVARIGMSFDHAKKLVEVINDTIEKNER